MTVRYPYAAPLMAVDRIVEIAEESIRVAKAISGNEPFFSGHYPGHPIFPGNFIFEAVHQTAHCYVLDGLKVTAWIRLVEIRSIRFLSPLQPGDCLEIFCQCLLSPDRRELSVDADCRRGDQIAVARIKLRYVLED
jgi:3-hydroxymyristoyl/3-hydroxydecanoyl-(acyl carrier protein) dehydratase